MRLQIRSRLSVRLLNASAPTPTRPHTVLVEIIRAQSDENENTEIIVNHY